MWVGHISLACVLLTNDDPRATSAQHLRTNLSAARIASATITSPRTMRPIAANALTAPVQPLAGVLDSREK
jgi:hypothetical protein